MTNNDTSHDRKIQRFVRWLETLGADFSDVEIRYVNGLRGLYTRRHFEPEEQLYRIPRHAIISIGMVKDSLIGRHLCANNIKLLPCGWHAFFLAHYKRQRNSFIKPYLDVLPGNYRDLPIHFTSSEMKYLRGSSLEYIVKWQKVLWEHEFKKVNACLNESDRFTYSEYAWGRASSSTRSHAIKVDDEKINMLIPGACMMNHALRLNNLWPDCQNLSKDFLRVAKTPLEANTEIHECYGAKGNVELFKAYGIVMDNNPYDETDITFPLPRTDHPLYCETKESGRNRDGEFCFSLPFDLSHDNAHRLFSFLRLACETDVPVVQRELATGTQPNAMPVVSRHNEIAALQILVDACRQRLSKFETSIEEDEHLLKTAELPYRLRCAINVRMGEKRILQRYLSLTDVVIPMLRINAPTLAAAMLQRCQPGNYFTQYIRAVVTKLYPETATVATAEKAIIKDTSKAIQTSQIAETKRPVTPSRR